MAKHDEALFAEGAQAPAAAVAVTDLAREFSIETTVNQAKKIESFAALLPEGTRCFVTFLPGEDVEPVIALARRLRDEGMTPTPHVAARNIASEDVFERYVGGLAEAGCDEALVIAGGAETPLGPYSSSLELLESGAFERAGFRRLALAGHPEGNKDIGEAGLREALARKNAIAASSPIEFRLVTQFAFRAEPVLAWERAIRAEGNALPIDVGVAGPASIKNLLKYAKMCGVEASLSMLAKHAGKLLQLAGSAAPDPVIAGLAAGKSADSGSLIRGLHYYPFGGFAKTSTWAVTVAAGEFQMNWDGSGFRLIET